MPKNVPINSHDAVIMWLLHSKRDLVHKAADNKPEDCPVGQVHVVVTVNGIEMNYQDFNSLLERHVEEYEKRLEKKYADQEEEIQRRVEGRLKEEAQPIIDKLQNLAYALEDVDSAITPYWEKKS